MRIEKAGEIMKKILAIVLSVTLVLGLCVTVYAHDWPSNVEDWDDDDWDAFYDYFYDSYEDEDWDDDDNYDYWDDDDDYYWDDDDDDDDYYWDDDDYYYYWDDDDYDEEYWDWYWEQKHRQEHQCDPNYGKASNYNGYNFYAGILDVYDGSTEDQATVLARIINIYAHGAQSQTAQACVGWAVMNSVDASSRGATVCDVAPNFGYDYSGVTTDDFGRDLKPLARDIIFRWKAGRAGIGNNGRVLPSGYCYVWSNGSALTFYTTPNGSGTPWNYSAASPYGS